MSSNLAAVSIAQFLRALISLTLVFLSVGE
jgi:hypothetical protein